MIQSDIQYGDPNALVVVVSRVGHKPVAYAVCLGALQVAGKFNPIFS